MGQQVLNNPQLPPTPELLQAVLGDNYTCLDSLMEMFDRHAFYRDNSLLGDMENILKSK